MNPATLQAFFNELGNIEKKASVISNVGGRILNVAKAGVKGVQATPGFLQHHAKDTVKNVSGAIGAFGAPTESIRKGWNMTTKDFGKMSLPMKSLMAGGIALDAHEALAKNDPTGQGRGRVQRVGASVGSQVGGLIGTPFGVSGSVAAGLIGRKIGGTVGKAGDAIRGYKKPQNAEPERLLPQHVNPTHASMGGRG